MKLKRIKTVEQLETLLDEVNCQFYAEDKWIEKFIVDSSYCFPEAFAKALFIDGETDFISYLGVASTITLRRLQSHAIEEALSLLSREKQRDFLNKLQNEEYIKTLQAYTSLERLAIIFDDILLISTEQALVVKESQAEGTRALTNTKIIPFFSQNKQGELGFLSWLFNYLDDYILSPALAIELTQYPASGTLKSLLNELIGFYYKKTVENRICRYGDEGTVYDNVRARISSAEQAILAALARANKLINPPPTSLHLTEADINHSRVEEFLCLFNVLDEAAFCHLSAHPLNKDVLKKYPELVEPIAEEDFNITTKALIENKLTILAEKMTGREKSKISIDDAFAILRISKSITLEAFQIFWQDHLKRIRSGKNAYFYWRDSVEVFNPTFLNHYLAYQVIYQQFEFGVSLPEKESSNQVSIDDVYKMLDFLNIDKERWDSLTTAQINAFYRQKARQLHPDKNREKDACELTTLLTEAVKYKEILLDIKKGIKTVAMRGAPEEATPKPLSLTANSSPTRADENHTTTMARQDLQQACEQLKGILTTYLQQRRWSSFLIQHDLGFLVKLLSKLRYEKVSLVLNYKNTITAENYNEKKAALSTNIEQEVRKNKIHQLEKEVGRETKKALKKQHCPYAFFWRFASGKSDGGRKDEAIVREHQETLDGKLKQDGLLGKLLLS